MDGLPKNHFGAILADPPWPFRLFWNGRTNDTPVGVASRAIQPYKTMSEEELLALPVKELSADDCILFLWISWPALKFSLNLIEEWGFSYKTCAFTWMKAHAGQIELFEEEISASMGMGYWTRSNSEVALLATKGKPRRLSADVRQGIIAPRREHSRKPDGIHERIERLVGGPYLELFARQQRPNWTTWGNETDKFKPVQDWDSMWQKPFARPELL